jgi:hypothetical protein
MSTVAADDFVTERWCELQSGTIKEAIESHNAQMVAYMERVEKKVNRHEVAIVQIQQREKNGKEFDEKQERKQTQYLALCGVIGAFMGVIGSNIDKLAKLFQ